MLSARRPRRVVRGLGRAFLYVSIYPSRRAARADPQARERPARGRQLQPSPLARGASISRWSGARVFRARGHHSLPRAGEQHSRRLLSTGRRRLPHDPYPRLRLRSGPRGRRVRRGAGAIVLSGGRRAVDLRRLYAAQRCRQHQVHGVWRATWLGGRDVVVKRWL